MQFHQKDDQFKRLKLILGQKNVQKLRNISILLVGVGGIGCQVLKNISKHPIKKLTIIDMDIIQLSNLNRQFYFRKEHIGKSKAKIAHQEILKIAPTLNIESIQGNIYDSKYDNYHFYSQFNLVISALDNMKARQHLAKNCTKYGLLLIDAGTSGFNGQSYPNIRFKTSCHNCYPSNQQQNFAVCTIRTKPERSIHCAIYSKNIYQQFFGDSGDDFLQQQIRKIRNKLFNAQKVKNNQQIKNIGIQLFNYLFCYQFDTFIKNHDEQLKINRLLYENVIKEKKDRINKSNYSTYQNIPEIAIKFINNFQQLVNRKINHNQIAFPIIYDKDDQNCSQFVYSLTNLRIHNFKSNNQQTKLKYLTSQQCRKMIGKIIPAIASTNSIAAALQTKQIIDYLSNKIQPAKYLTISPYCQEKISYSWISLPNPQCLICSPKNLYFEIACQLNERTFQEFQQFARQNCYSYGRDVYCKNIILIKNINSNKISLNKKKVLSFKKDLMIQNTLVLKYLPKSKISDLTVQITLIDQKQQKGKQQKFQILNKNRISQTLKYLNQLRQKTQTCLKKYDQQNVEKSQQYIIQQM